MTDTIAAISTALGVGAISIIRVSGKDSVCIANKIFKGANLKNVPTHTIHYGHIIDNDECIDEVLVAVMKAPKTFTKEDVVEINCHGSITSTNKILELLLKNGARLAEPGEFTKIAFLNGRIDLMEAESVMSLINAKSDKARSLAMNGISGIISKKIKDIRQEMLELMANIEVNIDYPEYEDALVVTNKMVLDKVCKLKEKLLKLLDDSKNGKIINDGIKTIIIGSPNVGKSSLLNRLLEEERAIVTDIAGTTRDTVEGFININGITLNIIDTAGIRDTDDAIESIGVKKSLDLINTSDLIILVLNSNEKLSEYDKKLLQLIKDKNHIIVINKIDLENKIDFNCDDKYVVNLSVKDDMGIDKLKKCIKDIFNLGNIENKDLTYLSTVRQIDLIKNSLNHLNDVEMGIKKEIPTDILEIDLTSAWEELGKIIGESYSEELIDQLFSQFCLGK